MTLATRSTQNLPDCQEAHGANSDNRANARRLLPRADQRRCSRSADARLIEEKRRREREDAAVLQNASESPSARDHGVLPIVAVNSDLYEATSPDGLSTRNRRENSIASSSPTSPPRSFPTVASVEEVAHFKIWWQLLIKQTSFTRDDATVEHFSSIRRRRPPVWRDLCDEAKLDFYQDEALAIAAASPEHRVFHVIINLAHEIEWQAIYLEDARGSAQEPRRRPNAPEWCKYRISRTMALHGLPCSFLMISEEAEIKNADHQIFRRDLGLHPSKRLHIHALMVLPVSRRAHQTFRNALRAPSAVGSWNKAARGRQIGIVPGHYRVQIDYLAKGLIHSAKMHRWHDDVCRSRERFRNYDGEGLTVSKDLRLGAAQHYEAWRESAR